jgi:hypothetical protein
MIRSHGVEEIRTRAEVEKLKELVRFCITPDGDIGASITPETLLDPVLMGLVASALMETSKYMVELVHTLHPDFDPHKLTQEDLVKVLEEAVGRCKDGKN